MKDFSNSSLRYSRIAAIGRIGNEGVDCLRNGRVLIVGCGALGSMSAMYLAASGIGRIGIVDFDTIDLSNLQRQLFFSEEDLGKPKADILKQRMLSINSGITVDLFNTLFTASNADRIIAEYDFIIDGSDNPSTKLLIAQTCEQKGVAYTIGGVRELTGQVMTWTPGHATYSEIFGDVSSCNGFMPCSAAGVLGPVAGIIASTQSAEAIKYIANFGQLLTDRLMIIDLEHATTTVIPLA